MTLVWLEAPLRKGVLQGKELGPDATNFGWEATAEFAEWSKNLIGEWRTSPDGMKIEFTHEDDLVAYLVVWIEEWAFDPVIMPIIRRVMPTIIANDILGVQPMAGTASFLHALRSRYLGDPEDEV